MPLSPEELEEALSSLLAERERTGDVYSDAVAAVKRAYERRVTNSRDGGRAIEALRDQGLSWRRIEAVTGVDKDTARRWAEPPGSQS